MATHKLFHLTFCGLPSFCYNFIVCESFFMPNFLISFSLEQSANPFPPTFVEMFQ